MVPQYETHALSGRILARVHLFDDNQCTNPVSIEKEIEIPG